MNTLADLTRALKVYEDFQSPRRHRGRQRDRQDFTCKHCLRLVSTHSLFSGVQNRNHCPYCLWSRHMDLYTAGDRLAACKSGMQPVGLTLKQNHKKYSFAGSGELMLIHQCIECSKVSINRLASDDDADAVWEVYEESLVAVWRLTGIHRLGTAERHLLQARLYGVMQAERLAISAHANANEAK